MLAQDEILRRGYRYAVALTGDPVHADDLLHDAWLRVRGSNGPRGSIRYLYRAIRSAWVDGRRRAERSVVELGSDERAVTAEAERLIEADALWMGLQTLSGPQREVLYLQLVEGWTTKEIAERTGTSRNTVLSHLRRGKSALRAWIIQHTEAAV
jgi:RNA polymerase sigma-70 factor (ECF subfamily)